MDTFINLSAILRGISQQIYGQINHDLKHDGILVLPSHGHRKSGAEEDSTRQLWKCCDELNSYSAQNGRVITYKKWDTDNITVHRIIT